MRRASARKYSMIVVVALAMASWPIAAASSRSTAQRCKPHVLPCASQLSIKVVPNPSLTGQSVSISGQLRGRAIGGAAISLWQELPWQRKFHQIARTRVDAVGVYQFTRSPRYNAKLYVFAAQ